VQIARGLGRRRELGIRAAIGATRARLLVQLTLESLVLAFAGGLAGVLVARWTLAALGAIAQDSVRIAAGAGLDGTVLTTGIGLSLVAGVLCGAIPAWRASRGAPAWTQQRLTTGDAVGTRLRSVLVTSQIALSVVLAAVAALLSVSLVNVLRVDPGFRPDQLVAFDLSVPPSRFETYATRATLVRGVETAVGAPPGVAGTCAINEIPFDGQNAAARMTYVPEGQERAVAASPRNITPGCVDLLGLPLLRGRLFADREPTRVALVTARFAERAWPGADPIGRRVHVGVKTGDLIEVVGVVGDSLQSSLETGTAPQVYECASERAAFWADKILVRTTVTPASLLTPIRAAVRRVDPDQPVARLRLVRDIVGDSVNDRRVSVALAAGFAGLTIVLTVVGAYALMAQTVSQRTAEFGVRLALGAAPRGLVAVVMRQAWILAAIGIAIGVAGAFLATRLLRQLVFGVSVTDPRVLAGAALVLTAVSLVAAWIPARRAAHVDPIAALRVE
jgi:putative ABC transport system permease protein